MSSALQLRTKPWSITTATVVAVVIADQLAKTWALHSLDDGRSIPLVWTLRLQLVLNDGGAFGLFPGNAWVFVVVAVVVVAALLVAGRQQSGGLSALSLGLVVGGAVGNVGDRLFRDLGGRVVDFVDLQWWPVFNLADTAIVVGCVLFFLAGREGSHPESTDRPGSRV